MRTRCPNCGTTISLDALIAHDGAREALGVAFKLSGPLGNALIRYVGLFRPETRELTMDRVGKLLTEVLPYIQAQRIERMADKIVQITACSGWYWVSEEGRENPIVEPIAVWALLDSGVTVGLVDGVDKDAGPTLERHPKAGNYVEWNNLNSQQRIVAKRQVPSKD